MKYKPGLARNLLESVARGKRLWRRLPAEFDAAPILLSPDARLQHLKLGRGAFDPMLLELAESHVTEKSVVWDIGANLGVFSLAAATRARQGYVIAIEPDPWLFSLLSETKAHRKNSGRQLELLCAAIADQPGLAQLNIAHRGRASNFLEVFGGRTQTGGIRYSCLAPILTLDLLGTAIPRPTIIKIDVEGAEFAVLQGGETLLREARPLIAIEVGDETRERVIARLRAFHYELFDQNEPGVRLTDAAPVSNILAVPQ